MPATSTTNAKAKKQINRPKWAEEVSEKFQSAIAHAFILHGNIKDYVAVVPGQNLRDYLVSSFADRDVVVIYDRATGFTFPNNNHKKRFKEATGLAETMAGAMGARGGGLAGALNQAAGSGANDDTLLEQMGRQPVAALNLLSRLLRYKPAQGEDFRAAVILDYAETLVPASESASAPEADRTAYVTLAEWGRDPVIANADNIIMMIVADLQSLNEQLRKSGARWEQVEIPFPTASKRAEFARLLVEAPDSGLVMAQGFSYEDLARLTTGLALVHIEDIVLRAAFAGQPVSRQIVKSRKDEIVSAEFDDVLQIVESDFGFEALGGLAEVKEALTDFVIKPMGSGQRRLVPQGIIMMGPAGTGKSRIARALAKEAGFTFVELQPSKIFSKYVGDTERRLEKALTAIKSMAPCIVFIDEIDQSVSRGESGDNGVSNRVFKRLMEVMADTSQRGRVLWIGATNRPDLLDAALLRPGRFDEKIPVLAPDANERTSILAVLTKQAFAEAGGTDAAKLQLPAVNQYSLLAARMDGYTGAEIELVVSKAVKLWSRASDSLTIAEALEMAFERIIPTTQDVEAMSELALLNCSDLDLVPASQREKARTLRMKKQAASTQAGEDEDEIESIPQSRKARRREF